MCIVYLSIYRYRVQELTNDQVRDSQQMRDTQTGGR
nr:MAG TPA: hypothetical protein [Bacteriophage sp.]